MTFEELLDQAIAMLERRGRVTYRALKRQFQLDDDVLEDLTAEIIKAQRLAVDEDGEVLVWTGILAGADRSPAPAQEPMRAPHAYTPPHLAEKIRTVRSALAGERKQVTVLFADLKSSMELLADRDPEEARQLLDPVLERMMVAVHRYEGTVNQVMGDGIMALFGAPIAHEDHAVRACYAALQRLLKAKKWGEALAQVDVLLAANPLAAQLYLLRGQLIQLQGESTAYALADAEAAFKRALELDGTYFDVPVELMHFYDAVCADPAKALAYAKQVKALAQKALDEASDVLEDTTTSVS